MRIAMAAIAALASAFIADMASAQPSRAPDEATARIEQARVLVAKGKHAEACAEFETSFRIERALGTLDLLSDCYERVGRLASAWSGFRDVAIAAFVEGQAERAHKASRRAEALGARLPKLRIEVPPGVAGSNVEVHRNGLPVSRMLWGVDVPVNPGGHELRVTAAGQEVWIGSVDVTEGRTLTVRVPQDVLSSGRGDAKGVAGATAAPLMDRAAAEDARAAWFYGAHSGAGSQWVNVRASLLDAWNIHGEPWIAAEVGRTELMLGDYRNAAEHLASFKREAGSAISSLERLRAEFLLDIALRRVGTLILRADVKDADVLVDGNLIGEIPLGSPVYVAPGERVIEVRRSGYTSVRMTIKAAPGETYPLSFELVENLPLRRDEPKVNSVASGVDKSVASGVDKRIVVVGSTAAALLAANGVVTALLGSAQANAADGVLRDTLTSNQSLSSSARMEYNDHRRNYSTFSSIALWSLIGAGAAGLGTVVYGQMASTPAPRTGVQALPVVMGRGGGVVIVSTW